MNAICHPVNVDGVVILFGAGAGHLNTTLCNQSCLNFL